MKSLFLPGSRFGVTPSLQLVAKIKFFGSLLYVCLSSGIQVSLFHRSTSRLCTLKLRELASVSTSLEISIILFIVVLIVRGLIGEVI